MPKVPGVLVYFGGVWGVWVGVGTTRSGHDSRSGEGEKRKMPAAGAEDNRYVPLLPLCGLAG